MERQTNGSNFYILSSQILSDKNLSHAEKLTMAILNGLSDEEGKCYPSNEWLGEKLDLHPRKIQTILENLEKNNYIKREIVSCVNNPFKKYRNIYTNTNFKLSLPDAENGVSVNAENGALHTPKTACIINKKDIIDKKDIEKGSLKRAQKESAPPPPPPDSFYKGKFEDKIKITPEQREALIKKWGVESLVDAFAEKLYKYSYKDEKRFNKYKRHDMVIDEWIEKDIEKKAERTRSSSGLNDAQQKNWELNQALVDQLKLECPNACGGLNWYYKAHVLRDSKNPNWSVSGKLEHTVFREYLEKSFKLKLLEE